MIAKKYRISNPSAGQTLVTEISLASSAQIPKSSPDYALANHRCFLGFHTENVSYNILLYTICLYILIMQLVSEMTYLCHPFSSDC